MILKMRVKSCVLLYSLLHLVVGDYECLCNFNGQQAVYAETTLASSTIGDLHQYDCKPTLHGSKMEEFTAIQYEGKVGYVPMISKIQIQICPGNPSRFDVVPVTTAVPQTIVMTAQSQTSLTSTSFTSSSPATASSTTTTTTAMKSTTPKIVQGHLEVCPGYLNTDISQYHGFLGQYGSFCYELVDWPRAFQSAESHCKALSGTLTAITSQGEQDYIEHFLSAHGYTKQVWIGLNDKTSEGTLTWTSGTPVSYTNFQNEYNHHSTNTHKNNDCFVINQGGEWVDQPCGVAISIINFGEQHPFICQYDVSAKLHTLFDLLPGVAVG